MFEGSVLFVNKNRGYFRMSRYLQPMGIVAEFEMLLHCFHHNLLTNLTRRQIKPYFLLRPDLSLWASERSLRVKGRNVWSCLSLSIFFRFGIYSNTIMDKTKKTEQSGEIITRFCRKRDFANSSGLFGRRFMVLL